MSAIRICFNHFRLTIIRWKMLELTVLGSYASLLSSCQRISQFLRNSTGMSAISLYTRTKYFNNCFQMQK